MTARFASCYSADRCCAVARSSARICPILDTAVILVVSICVLAVRNIMAFA